MATDTKGHLDDAVLSDLEEWRKLHPEAKHWDVDDVASWIVEQKHKQYSLDRRIIWKEIAKQLSRAQSRKRVRNGQGVLVGEYHAARLPVQGRKKQKTFWAHRLRLDASFAHTSIDQRVRQAEGFCRSISNDAKDLNENNENMKDNQIQLDLNFNYVDSERRAPEIQTVPTGKPAPKAQEKKKKPRPR